MLLSPQYQVYIPPKVKLSPITQQLNLREWQVPHFNITDEILKRFPFYIDGSKMGDGKTYIALAHAIRNKLPVIVVCPKTAKATWSNACAMYGVELYNLPETGGIITYDKLRSKKGFQPKHGLLVRDDTGEGVKFYPTTTFNAIVEQGVLIVFDECHKLKNKSDQHHAVKTMIKVLYRINKGSRAAFLSGSLMEKDEHCTNFMRLVGFINQRNLYSIIQGEVRLEGIEDLHQWARTINLNKFNEFVATHPFVGNREAANRYVIDLFVAVIKPGIMSIMTGRTPSKDIKNGYYNLDKQDSIEYNDAVAELTKVVRYNADTGMVVRTAENMGAITKSLIRIQKAKMKAMAYKAWNMLSANPTCKVILFADYYEVIDYLLGILRNFNPLELTGRISEKKRIENVELFQQQNTNHRLIIGNPVVGGVSVNLHDVTGNFPRFTYMMAGYRVNELHQATGRTDRDGLIGIATIRFFYGDSGMLESNILTALAKKGEVLEKLHTEQGEIFPNQYESVREQIVYNI